MKTDNLFTELKRRNVFRAGAFYAACAWLLVQVATQVFPFFHISEWVVRWIILAALIGFPFWLAAASRGNVSKPPVSERDASNGIGSLSRQGLRK